MSTRHTVAAGVVTLAPASEADWQVLSGDWATAGNWSTGAVPGIANPVVINRAAPNEWLVTATSESALSLFLGMDQGTLEATEGLTVAGTLTQTAGTLLADPGTTILVAALEQSGGTVVLNDDSTATTTLDSGGTDLVNGVVALVEGAVWIDQVLGIGLGLSGGDPVSAAVTLQGGALGSQLAIAAGLQIGGDPTGETAGGFGSLELDGGSGAFAADLMVLNGSVISVDVDSFMTIGNGAAPEAGAIVVAAGAGVLADIATLGADVINAGQLSVVGWQGGGQTAPGDVLITGSLVSAGLVTVETLATLSVTGSVEIDSGSLTVGGGGTLAVGNANPGSTGLFLAGGALVLDGAVLNSFGTADFANSNASLLHGAAWAGSTISIAPGYADGTNAFATISLAGGSTLFASNGIDIGNDPVAGTNLAMGVGSLLLSGSSTVEAFSLALLNGSQISLDASSTVMIGSAAAELGTVAVAADGLLVADIATVTGNLDAGGTFDVVAFAGTSPSSDGDVRVTGVLSGHGAIAIDGTLEVGSARSFSGKVTIAGGGTLILDSGDMARGRITATGGTATIEVAGQAFDSGAFFPTYDARSGLLVFGNAAGQSTLDVGTGRALTDFSLAADGNGTLITEAPCYAAGTRIATQRGEVMVQHLRVGDRVRLAGGATAAVQWLGQRRVACRRHPRPADVQPVRIAAHAFGLGRPTRALRVSPDHAVFVDSVLIPVRYLLNDATVRQEDVSAVTYWHVELPAHDVLLAEGLPAESYLDTGNRAAFANAGNVVMAHPDFARSVWERQGCAPLVTAGPVRDLVYRRLLAQAFALGWNFRDSGVAAGWTPPGGEIGERSAAQF